MAIKPIPFTPAADEQEMFALLDRILTDSAKANGQSESGDITAMLFKKRFLSSPYSFGMTLRSYLNTHGKKSAPDELDYDDILGDGASDEEEGLWEQDESTAIRHSKSADALGAAKAGELDRLADWGLSYASRPDTRLTQLIKDLDAICRPGGFWSNERVVIFTEYANTLEWVERLLRQQGYEGRVEVIQGSTPTDERELIRERFTSRTRRPSALCRSGLRGEDLDDVHADHAPVCARVRAQSLKSRGARWRTC